MDGTGSGLGLKVVPSYAQGSERTRSSVGRKVRGIHLPRFVVRVDPAPMACGRSSAVSM